MVKNKKVTTKQLLEVIIESIKEKKGKDIVQIDFSKIGNAIADTFIICHGDSTTQVEAISDNIKDKINEKLSIKTKYIEGKRNAQWVLIDFSDIVVHIFLEPVRRTYNLEGLWADGEFHHHNDH